MSSDWFLLNWEMRTVRISWNNNVTSFLEFIIYERGIYIDDLWTVLITETFIFYLATLYAGHLKTIKKRKSFDQNWYLIVWNKNIKVQGYSKATENDLGRNLYWFCRTVELILNMMENIIRVFTPSFTLTVMTLYRHTQGWYLGISGNELQSSLSWLLEMGGTETGFRVSCLIWAGKKAGKAETAWTEHASLHTEKD